MPTKYKENLKDTFDRPSCPSRPITIKLFPDFKRAAYRI